MPSISLIITIKNESKSIRALLESIVAQVRLPDEVILIDGGSTDDTEAKVVDFLQSKKSDKVASWQFAFGDLNISQGRNKAISMAQHSLLAITDAGCVLDVHWLQELEKTFIESKAKQNDEVVVAGFYAGDPKNGFERAVVPYVLVMPDQVDERSFLPATRSMLLPKSVWQELGGFDEKLQVSEDFAFAKKIVTRYGQTKIIFCETAVVYWRPRSSIWSFFKMIFKMAEGDIRAGIYRGKVKLLFGRYIGGLLILAATLKSGRDHGWIVLLFGLGCYVLWSVLKNKKYAEEGWYWLPILQLTADMAVLSGSLSGLRYDTSQ